MKRITIDRKNQNSNKTGEKMQEEFYDKNGNYSGPNNGLSGYEWMQIFEKNINIQYGSIRHFIVRQTACTGWNKKARYVSW